VNTAQRDQVGGIGHVNWNGLVRQRINNIVAASLIIVRNIPVHICGVWRYIKVNHFLMS
jgi:hypothetical protein